MCLFVQSVKDIILNKVRFEIKLIKALKQNNSI
jgi:hypothetical protein